MKWGKFFQQSDDAIEIDHLSRMGKTIQIISLFVTDGAKPNLVVAYVISLRSPFL
jgi:hypothetical protein